MKTKRVNRRHFLKTGLLGLAGSAAAPALFEGRGAMPPARTEKEGKRTFRTLGRTGIRLPIVSMGVMNADNPNLVAAALDSGILLLDTAHGYQKGKNEEMIGSVVKGRKRDSFLVATKVGYPKDRKTGLYPPEKDVHSFEEEFNISLRRLGLDYVDILYIHSVWVRETVFFEPAMKFLEKMKKEGKTRFMGFTTHRDQHIVLDAAAESGFYDVVLTSYNFRMENREQVRRAIARAAGAGIGIVAMKTQAGVYWDKERQQPINMKAALKWALQDENVHTAIPGFTTFDQMNLDLSVMEDLELTPQEKADLRLGTEKTLSGLYCSQCGTCTRECPSAEDVPTLMRGYMYAYGYRNTGLARQVLDELDGEPPCLSCTTCTARCPNGFDIPVKAREIYRLKAVPYDFLA